MAMKSDFAQKLLHDLRLRKERMAAAQSSDRQSGHMSTDPSRNPGRTYRGAQQIIPLESVGSGAGNPSRSSNRGSRSINFPESSSQIVIYEKGQNSRQVRDLAMAIAFAFENREKLTKMGTSSSNPLVNFFNRFGRRSMDCRKMDITSSNDHSLSMSQFPAVSQIHITEISKGVQKLNQILRDCSSGIKFDRNSTEVGKELLKGYIDLEESLRMLVNLQGASAYTNGAQQKDRIKLLEEDEEDQEDASKTADQWKLSRPRFSFDNTSRGPHVARCAKKYNSNGQQLALSYQDETSEQSVSRSNIINHKRSASFTQDHSLSMQEKRNSNSSTSQPTQEKGRISNVIAKLMGIEELSLSEDSMRNQQDSKQKDGKETKDGTQRKVSSKSNKLLEPFTRDSRSGSPLSTDKKPLQTKTTPVIRDHKAEKKREAPDGSSKMVNSDGNKVWKDVKVIAVGTGEASANSLMHKRQDRSTELNQVDELQTSQGNKRKLNLKKDRERNISEARDKKESILKAELPLKATNRKTNKVEDVAQNGTEYGLAADSSEKRNANKDFPSNRLKPHNQHASLQVKVPKRPESEDRRRAEQKDSQFQKQHFLTKKQEGHKLDTFSSKPKKITSANLQKRIPHEKRKFDNQKMMKFIEIVPPKNPLNRNQDQAPTNDTTKMSAANQEHLEEEEKVQNLYPRDPQFDEEKEKQITVSVSQKKVISQKFEKTENRRKIDELVKRRNATEDNLTKSVKQSANMLQDLKQQMHNKYCSSKEMEQQSDRKVKEGELGTIMHNASEMKAETLEQSDKLQNEAEQVIRYSYVEDVCQTENKPSMPTFNNCHDDTSNFGRKVSDNLQTLDQPYASNVKQELKQCDQSSGGPEQGTTPYNLSQHEYQQFPISGRQEQLTEPEKDLKEIVIQSQLFLNTAEALFKLNIPISFLHASDHNVEVADKKLMLDCGYEVMKRKARRHEVTLHPYSRTNISCNKVRSLDDLVKQLCEEFEILKSYGGDGNDERDTADRLYKMLNKDIYDKDPDVNSMWDFEWNKMMSAFPEKEELVRDVEKHMLNGLLDEITNDLVLITVSV